MPLKEKTARKRKISKVSLPPEHLRKLFGGKCDFVFGVAQLGQLPDFSLPEVAFAGRSNVGKSSLINAIMGRDIAHVSKTPGRTQQLNFFNTGDKFHLVDMPGYGYAKVSKQMQATWDLLIKDYLRGRPNLRSAFVLVDSRHGLKDTDRQMMKMLDEAAVSYRVILTKIDEVKKKDLEQVTDFVETYLKKSPAAFPLIHPVSSREKTGIEALQQTIFDLIK
ncbi:MAG: YihA family ribosome biogenesis GTP-binding protein [Micavibrio aeruginosavorus]|uniref:Probable GTP-binding protein EngB n=1 Tax=Micavibrio aeruginosavorus TaxID=349221 RepID=A0A2W5HUZ0_9BACT|nr:MAG: YihA family ribosome biogenesis GTP-binding protein [Micavibrio aeruginosavorus]